MGATASVTFNTMTGEANRPQPARTTRSCLIRVAHTHNKFAFRLYYELVASSNKIDNIVCCPLGISLGLGLLMLGAKGTTREEMMLAFNADEVDETQQLPAFAAIHWDATRSTLPKGCQLEFALSIFAQHGHDMIAEYEEICSIYELSPLRHADFDRGPDAASKQISEWIEERTRRKFVRALPDNALAGCNTKLLGMNAAYIKVRWLKHFDLSQTSDEAFHLSTKQTLTVRIMHRKDVFRWGTLKKPNCSVLELPFANGHMKMYVMLPQKLGDIGKMEKALARTNVSDILKCLSDNVVNVYLPHFTCELQRSLKDSLQRLRIRDLFADGKADLSGIDGTGELFLSTFYQCARICVDEGIEEANPGPSSYISESNGGVHNNTTTDLGPIKTFRADRPFVFYVFDDRTEAILFIGRVMKPHST